MATRQRKTLADFYVGICPACSQPVSAEEGATSVWTCRADLAESNVYYEPLPEDWQTTETQKEADGYFANCPEGRPTAPALCPMEYPGGPGHMPLHAACYERGNY